MMISFRFSGPNTGKSKKFIYRNSMIINEVSRF